MARGHADLPAKAAAVVLRKGDIFAALKRVDGNEAARDRVLQMETSFRLKIATHLIGLPPANAKLKKFNTSPFVRSEEHTPELQSLMRHSYAVFCANKNNSTQPTTPSYSSTL